MPRTKRASKAAKQVSISLNTEKSNAGKLGRKQAIDAYLKHFDLECEYKVQELRSGCDEALRKLHVMNMECRKLVPSRITNTPLEDVVKVLAESTRFITVSDTTSCSNVSEITNTARTGRVRKNKRSLSLADDEGYLTAEHSENSGGTRRSRADSKRTRTAKTSRSLSRTQIPQASSVVNNYKTPANKKPNDDFGFVTPKVKRNTPQVILRRPKEGELAISMQGSPLLVNSIVSQDANVNIPLGDGRTISIQPQHGIRLSQLPAIDSTIKRQIEVLRDNLIKVCELTK